MEKKGLITVIVPVHNAEPYLSRCLGSLRAQIGRNIEFLIINNGSTDDSLCIMEQYAKTDTRFRVISQENRGVLGSRNRGLDEARGEYLGFVDADDFVEPDMYERLRRALNQTNSDMAVCDYTMTYTTHGTPSVMGYAPAVLDQDTVGMERLYLHYLGPNPVVWNKLYRRELFEKEHLRFEVNIGEDVLLHLRMLPDIRRMVILDFTGYHYVQRKSSVMHSLHTSDYNGFSLLDYYFSQGCNLRGEGLLPYYFFSGMFTGFMFSSHCVGQSLPFFKQQVQLLKGIPFFREYCKKILTTEELTALYVEGTISIRFYAVQKMLCRLCSKGQTGMAALFLWICSKLITVKKRMLLQDLFD